MKLVAPIIMARLSSKLTGNAVIAARLSTGEKPPVETALNTSEILFSQSLDPNAYRRTKNKAV